MQNKYQKRVRIQADSDEDLRHSSSPLRSRSRSPTAREPERQSNYPNDHRNGILFGRDMTALVNDYHSHRAAAINGYVQRVRDMVNNLTAARNKVKQAHSRIRTESDKSREQLLR